MGGNKLPIVAGVLVLGALAGFLFYNPKPASLSAPVLTAEGKQYLSNLALSDVEMKAADSTLNVSLLEITGKIANKGTRPLQQVRVTCLFREPNLRVVKRERVTVIGLRTGTLEPGATKSFRLNFDDVPQSWNQTMPDLVIAELIFR